LAEIFLFKREFCSAQIRKLPRIKNDEIRLENEIGKGNFGEVFEGRYMNENTGDIIKVAIKKLKKKGTAAEKKNFLKEAVLLNLISHPNLVHFYGVCFENESENDPKYIILEYINEGDLLTFLRKKRESESLMYKTAVKICLDIVKGCKYLEDLKVTHRDIAARNCLVNIKKKNSETDKEVDDDDLTVKLGDFGLARDIYENDYYRQQDNKTPLPIRWMAPELFKELKFTTKSDIWSFGVVVWEIMTLGKQPYLGMDNDEVIKHIRKGGSLEIHDTIPNEMYY
jgi:proto-oncogene tyrosine-protein kinase ROS